MTSKTALLTPLNIENVTYAHLEEILTTLDQLAGEIGDNRRGFYTEKLEELMNRNHVGLNTLLKSLYVNLMYTRGCLEEIVSLRANIYILRKEKAALEKENVNLREKVDDFRKVNDILGFLTENES